MACHALSFCVRNRRILSLMPGVRLGKYFTACCLAAEHHTMFKKFQQLQFICHLGSMGFAASFMAHKSKAQALASGGRHGWCHTFSATTWPLTSPRGHILLSVHRANHLLWCTGADNLGEQIEGGAEPGAQADAGGDAAGGIEGVLVSVQPPPLSI